MVNFTKWAVIAGALVFLGLFTQEAAARGLTGTLERTGLSIGNVGSGIRSLGSGVGGFFTGTLQPFWEIRNLVRGFMNLGSAVPWLEDLPTQGGGTTSLSGGGGGDVVNTPTSIETVIPDITSTGGFTYYTNPKISSQPVTDTTITWRGGQTVDLPLSADAVKFYENVGVDVQPQSGGGATLFTGGGGGSGSSPSGSSSSRLSGWGHNVRTPSGGVASGNLSLKSWSA